jgi:FixJ family two-component response regulator
MSSSPARDPLVYVVDDDAGVLNGLSRLLRAWSYRVRTFASAREFLAEGRGADEEVACVVVDVHMPGLSGLQLQTELKRAQRPLPVVFVTGHGDASLSDQLVAAGAVGLLQKPFTEAELLRALQKAGAPSRISVDG